MWRGQTRFVRQMVCLGCVFLSVLVLLAASAAFARTWKSRDGKFQVEADLVKSENGKVTLRKSGGKTITVDESQLSDEDRAYLRAGEANISAEDSSGDAKPSVANPPPRKKPLTFLSLAQQANDCHTAVEVLALYKEFLADSSIDENERLSARNNLPVWESRVAKKMVRSGTRWLEPEQTQKFKEKATALVQEAFQLAQNKQAVAARKKLRDASGEDTESLQANFFSGLICVLGIRDFPSAKQEFTECVRRQPKDIPSLNNLALVEVRLRHYSEAIVRWKAALDAGPPSKEVSQNIGRLLELAKNQTCRLPPTALKKIGELHQSLSAESQGTYDPRVGWLYMPLDPKEGRNGWFVSGKDVEEDEYGTRKPRIGEDRTCMRCNGSATLKCPNKQCGGGTVAGGTKTVVSGTSGNGETFYSNVPVRDRCGTCDGRGKVSCPDCVDGIDSKLTGRYTYGRNQRSNVQPVKRIRR